MQNTDPEYFTKERIKKLEAEVTELRRERQEQIDVLMNNPVTCVNGITHPVFETQHDGCIYCLIIKLEAQLAAANDEIERLTGELSPLGLVAPYIVREADHA